MEHMDKTLLIRRDTLFVLNFCLHILNSIWSFHFEADGFAREGFHEDLPCRASLKNA